MKEPPKETDIVCEKCGGKMLIREGRFGKFLACSNFPKCKNAKPLEEEKKIAGKCPECGANMVERKSKKGKIFYSCEKYPDCKFMSWDITTGDKCALCSSPMIQKGNRIKCSNKDCENYKLK
jgi:DNA topoisomerase-1